MWTIITNYNNTDNKLKNYNVTIHINSKHVLITKLFSQHFLLSVYGQKF